MNLNGNWQPAKTDVLPEAVNEALSGSVAWNGKVGIELPYHAGATYNVELNGDLKNVSSHLPSPLAKPAGESLPVNIKVDGNLNSFELTGQAGADNHFNSRWLLGQKLTLDRAIWAADSKTLPPLPEQSGVELNMPPMDGAEWLALFQKGATDKVGSAVSFPQHITLRTPALSLGNQQWNNLSIVSQPMANGTQVEAQGREINATLAMRNNAPWLATIKYLYYNPSVAKTSGDSTPSSPFPTTARISFRGWPDAQIRCAECWFWGQKFGRIDSDITISGDTLTLANGLIDTGFSRLTAEGEWVNNPGNERTSLKGKLRGQKIDAAAEFFGVTTPIRQSSFNVDYDLHWRKAPWQPDEATLNGIIHTQLGKGEITDISTGHAGQLLRLLSVDALMRSCALISGIPLAKVSILTPFAARRGLKTVLCTLMTRWWMAWKRISP